MKTKSISTLLLAAALMAPMGVRADDSQAADQGGAGATSAGTDAGAVNAAPNSGSAQQYGTNGAQDNPGASTSGSMSSDQGGAGTSAGMSSSRTLKGSISAIDAQANSLTLKTTAGETQQVIVPQTAQIKSKANKQLTFADLKTGQKVSVQCDASGTANEVQVQSSK